MRGSKVPLPHSHPITKFFPQFQYIAYFNASHFSQPRYHHRAKGCRQEFAGVWKVIQKPEVLIERHRFSAVSTC